MITIEKQGTKLAEDYNEWRNEKEIEREREREEREREREREREVMTDTFSFPENISSSVDRIKSTAILFSF